MDLFDLYQQGQIRKTNQRMRFNEQNDDHRHKRAIDEIDRLHGRIDRLLLVNEAIWDLLATKSGLTTDDLATRVAELDNIDGESDGRRQAKASDCACGAKVNPKSPTCVFCGAPQPRRSLFDAI